jgi:hypothetical protein
MPNDSPGIHDCDDGVTLISCLRSSSSTCLTSGSTRPSARTHPTGHSCSALTSQIFRPRTLRMVLAYPANAETDFAVRVDHEASLTGWFRYASIARFERTSLRRSPHRNMPMISSRRKFADQFGSPSSPILSRTPQAMRGTWCNVDAGPLRGGGMIRSNSSSRQIHHLHRPPSWRAGVILLNRADHPGDRLPVQDQRCLRPRY